MVKCSTFGWILLAAFTAEAWSAESAWQLASRLELEPRAALVVLVQQHGVDLAVQVRSARGIAFEQEGADQAFGTEVVFLENSSAARTRYELFVKPVFNGPPPQYAIERIETPSRAARAAARALSDINRKWLSGAPARVVLPIARNALRSSPPRLRDLALNACIDILIRSGQSAEAVELLQQQASGTHDRHVAIENKIYRDYQLATALWASLQLDAALEVAEALAREVGTSSQWHASVPESVRRALTLNIDATLAAIRAFAGRARGDRKLLQKGGDVIAATLKSLPESDYAMRARLTDYLAGYYSFIFDRSSNITSEIYKEATRLYELAGDRLSLAAIRNNEAYAELGRGNVETALQLYLETLELQKGSRHLEGEAHVRARLGYLYYTIGDYRRAEVRFRESLELYDELRLELKVIHTKLQLAELLRADGRVDEAATLLEDVRRRNGPRLSVEDRLRLVTQLALIHVDAGDIKAAERTLASLGPLDRYESRNWTSLQVSIRLFFLLDFEIVRARIDLARGASESAAQRVDAALAWLGDTRREPLQQLQLLQLQLSIFERRDDEQRFANVGERALALIESVRGSIDFHTQGPAWSARTSSINDALVSHYLTRYESSGRSADLERAFSLLEAARARNLREVRAAGLIDAPESSGGQTTRELRAANQALIRALLLDESSEPLERRLAKAEERYQLQNALARPTPIQLPILGSDGIRQQLDARTQAHILVPGATRSHLIVLARDSTRVVRLPKESELAALVDASLAELRSLDGKLERSRELATLLFPNEAAMPRPARVLIEADGVFAGVPFSILFDLQAEGRTPPAVTLAPSLSELFGTKLKAEAHAIAEARRKDLVIFADPAFALSTDLANGTSSAWRAGLARLPYTQVEAKAIAAYFGGDAVLTFDDTNATISNVVDEPARTARVLHIAAHGFGSPSDPFLVGLGLANDSDAAGSGLLTTHHISAVRYENELVVVSACESGQGRRLDGEGLMSVARSFLASGAKATLSTLWPVPDQANAEFMKEFYFALTQLDDDPAAALVHAQQKMKHSRQFGHPYYWGGFVLHVVDGSYRP